MKDDTRTREKITLTKIKTELDLQPGMIYECAVIKGT